MNNAFAFPSYQEGADNNQGFFDALRNAAKPQDLQNQKTLFDYANQNYNNVAPMSAELAQQTINQNSQGGQSNNNNGGKGQGFTSSLSSLTDMLKNGPANENMAGGQFVNGLWKQAIPAIGDAGSALGGAIGSGASALGSGIGSGINGIGSLLSLFL